MNKHGEVNAQSTNANTLGKYFAEAGYSPDDLHKEISSLSTSEQMAAIAAYEAKQDYLLMLEEYAAL